MHNGPYLLHTDAQVEVLALQAQIGLQSATTGYFHAYLCGVHYHWNRLDNAARHLSALQSFAQRWHHATLLLAGYELELNFALACGEHTADKDTTRW